MRKKKHNKQNDTKSKVEFVRSVCQKSCKLCDIDKSDVSGSGASDLFCYDFLYVFTPKSFLSQILPKTQKVGFWAHDIEEEIPTIDEFREFQDLFCSTGLCKTADLDDGECSNIEFCIGLFREFVVSDCGNCDDEEMTEQSDEAFFGNVWDGADASGCGWNRFGQAAEKAIHGKNGGKCKKRGKNKAAQRTIPELP